MQNVRLGLGLVDGPSQTLRAGFWRDGQGLRARLCQGLDQGLRDGIDAHGRDADPRAQGSQGQGQLVDAPVVRDRRAYQAKTVGHLHQFAGLGQDLFHRSLARGAVDVPGQAEPAATAATPGDLDEAHIRKLGVRRE
jgi:hypothetical protein